MTKQTQTIPVLQNQVQAGLPSPAEDLGAERINLADLLQTDRQDTFFMRASGQSMVNVGIHDQDILVIRRSKRPRHGHIVAATVDGNNFYVSCERVFRASLNDTPVVVLSNNDGCAVARNNEAKALGIKMGAPWFQITQWVEEAGLVGLTANFALYDDLSDRMMSLAAGLGPTQEIYSIDESFIDVSGVRGDLVERSHKVCSRILQWVGIPC